MIFLSISAISISHRRWSTSNQTAARTHQNCGFFAKLQTFPPKPSPHQISNGGFFSSFFPPTHTNVCDPLRRSLCTQRPLENKHALRARFKRFGVQMRTALKRAKHRVQFFFGGGRLDGKRSYAAVSDEEVNFQRERAGRARKRGWRGERVSSYCQRECVRFPLLCSPSPNLVSPSIRGRTRACVCLPSLSALVISHRLCREAPFFSLPSPPPHPK